MDTCFKHSVNTSESALPQFHVIRDNTTVKKRSKISRFGIPLILGLALLLVVKTFFLNFACMVTSESMAPTLKTKDLLMVSKVHQSFAGLFSPKIKRGDVVIFHTAGLSIENPSEKEHYVKRVVGLPGETVQITDGKVLINGKALDKGVFSSLAYLNADEASGFFSQFDFLTSGHTISVPEGQYFVLGDHSTDSLDSRYWGTLPLQNIEGKVVMKWWPFTAIGMVN